MSAARPGKLPGRAGLRSVKGQSAFGFDAAAVETTLTTCPRRACVPQDANVAIHKVCPSCDLSFPRSRLSTAAKSSSRP